MVVSLTSFVVLHLTPLFVPVAKLLVADETIVSIEKTTISMALMGFFLLITVSALDNKCWSFSGFRHESFDLLFIFINLTCID